MIELSHVSKIYTPIFGGVMRALDDVSFRVVAGEVVGLAGPAGAGKSTLVALVVGQKQPTSGTVRVDGIEPRRFVQREGMGYLPQGVAIPRGWRVAEALTRLAVLSGVPSSVLRERVDRVLAEFDLANARRARVRTLDLDSRMRLGLAQTVLTDYRVIVLDEPFDGTSPAFLERVRLYIAALRAFDRAILVASRDADALQQVADRVVHIDRGRIRGVAAPRGSTTVPSTPRSTIPLTMSVAPPDRAPCLS